MTIPFRYYPGVQNRVPGVYAEVDASRANSSQGLLPSVIFGQITGQGMAVPGVPVLYQGTTATKTLAGQGSMLSLMAEAYRKQDPFGPLWLVPLADDVAAIAATGTISIVASPGLSGTRVYYIAGQRLLQPVVAGQPPASIAASLAATINANLNLPVTATVAANVVTLVAKNAGACGNDILVIANYGGVPAGEITPLGMLDSVTPMVNGATNPSLSAALLGLGDQSFEFYAVPYNDTTSLSALEGHFSDVVGRWAWNSMLYGHAFIAYRGTVGQLTTFGTSRNSNHITCMGINGTATPYWLVAVDVCATAAVSVRADPNQPFNTLPLSMLPSPAPSRFVMNDRNVLLFDGISTHRVDGGGTVRIERLITMNQTNAAGQVDNSFLNAERMFQLSDVIRAIANFQASTFPRAIIIADDAPVPVHSSYVNTQTVRAAIVGYYQQLELEGRVTDSVSFAKGVAVENYGNGIFKELLPITLPNQLEQIAMLIQFKAV